MNRTIKFRGTTIRTYDPLTRLIKGTWVMGDLKQQGEFCAIDNGNNTIEVDTDSVGQYIGLQDTSTPPKYIFEGDIIEGKTGIRHLIKYDEESAAFLAYKLPINEFDNGCHIENDWVVQYEKKVIGNIFDHPELLKKEEK